MISTPRRTTFLFNMSAYTRIIPAQSLPEIIEQSDTVKELRAQLAAVTKERDAAVYEVTFKEYLYAERLKAMVETTAKNNQLKLDYDNLKVERDALAKDKQRLDWLLNSEHVWTMRRESIDAAMKGDK